MCQFKLTKVSVTADQLKNFRKIKLKFNQGLKLKA